MLNFEFTFIWVIINFLILYFVLKRILFKPVTKFIENRSSTIRHNLDDAEKSSIEAKALKEQYEEKLKYAAQEADTILNNAKEKANEEYQRIIRAAKSEAEQIRIKAREEMELERISILKKIKEQIVSLALSAASKVLEKNMNTENNKILVERFIDEEGAA